MPRFDFKGRFGKYIRPKTEADYEAEEKALRTKLEQAKFGAGERAKRLSHKKNIAELRKEIRGYRTKGRKKIKLFGRDIYV